MIMYNALCMYTLSCIWIWPRRIYKLNFAIGVALEQEQMNFGVEVELIELNFGIEIEFDKFNFLIKIDINDELIIRSTTFSIVSCRIPRNFSEESKLQLINL